jgi:trigger factor
MDVTVKKLSKSQVEISVSLPWEEWQEEIEHAVKQLARDVKVAGFRDGKAPRGVIEKRFGMQALLDVAAEHTVSHSYLEVLSREKIEAVGPPTVKLEKFAEYETFRYSAVVTIQPEVVLLPWRDAAKQINAEFAKQADIMEEGEIIAELEKLASMRAKFVTVNREARLDDNVLVDFSVLHDGVLIENGQSKKHPLVLGSGVFIPGFEEKLVGMRAGEEKTFELVFPDTYHAKHLASQPATFQVKMDAVQARELPKIDDEFAKGLGSFTSLEELKKNMREGILAEKKIKREEEYRTRIIDAIIEKTKIEHPDILVAEESQRMLRAFEIQVQSAGLDFSEYLAQMKKTGDELRKEWEPQAKKTLAAHLVLEALAKEGELDVDNQEVEVEMNKTLAQYQNVRDIKKKVDMERLYSSARKRLLQEKTLAWLKSL